MLEFEQSAYFRGNNFAYAFLIASPLIRGEARSLRGCIGEYASYFRQWSNFCSVRFHILFLGIFILRGSENNYERRFFSTLEGRQSAPKEESFWNAGFELRVSRIINIFARHGRYQGTLFIHYFFLVCFGRNKETFLFSLCSVLSHGSNSPPRSVSRFGWQKMTSGELKGCNLRKYGIISFRVSK